MKAPIRSRSIGTKVTEEEYARLDDIKTTQIYTQVSIRQLKKIHSATHPAHFSKPETSPPADAEAKDELLSALAAEDDEEKEPL